jgi:hypothetical protein
MDGNLVGSNASEVTTQTQNYLTSYSQLLSGLPLKIRIGGRSSESYDYVETFLDQEPKPSDGSGLYGPTVPNILQNLSKRLGVSYLLSESSSVISETRTGLITYPDLSLKDPSGESLTKFATTSSTMIQTIEGYTLGSVRHRPSRLFRGRLIYVLQGPDRYISEGIRPRTSNYTADDYATASSCSDQAFARC